MLAQLGETAGEQPGGVRGIAYLQAHAACGGSLVWPLGVELHLRHLVGAVRAQRLRYRPRRSGNPARRRLARFDPKRRRRLGRETGASYKLDYRGHETGRRYGVATAWALLGLMAVAKPVMPAVARGVRYLFGAQAEDGLWNEERFTRNRIAACSTCISRLPEIFPAVGAGALRQFFRRARPNTASGCRPRTAQARAPNLVCHAVETRFSPSSSFV